MRAVDRERPRGERVLDLDRMRHRRGEPGGGTKYAPFGFRVALINSTELTTTNVNYTDGICQRPEECAPSDLAERTN